MVYNFAKFLQLNYGFIVIFLTNKVKKQRPNFSASVINFNLSPIQIICNAFLIYCNQAVGLILQQFGYKSVLQHLFNVYISTLSPLANLAILPPRKRSARMFGSTIRALKRSERFRVFDTSKLTKTL